MDSVQIGGSNESKSQKIGSLTKLCQTLLKYHHNYRPPTGAAIMLSIIILRYYQLHSDYSRSTQCNVELARREWDR